MQQCSHLTSKGRRCLREAQPGSKYCWQHTNDKTSKTKEEKPSKQKEETMRKPLSLLRDILVSVTDLSENKNLPYKDFIQAIVKINNEIAYDNELGARSEGMLSSHSFEKMGYPLSSITIEIPNVEEYDPEREFISHTLHHSGGFTKGQLLYELAKIIPDVEDDAWGDHRFFVGLSLDRRAGSYMLDLE
jgi:hypothetical protein